MHVHDLRRRLGRIPWVFVAFGALGFWLWPYVLQLWLAAVCNAVCNLQHATTCQPGTAPVQKAGLRLQGKANGAQARLEGLEQEPGR